MVAPLNSMSSESFFGLQASSLNSKVSGIGINNNTNSAYYAKKGEPMYMEEMDADEDGIVSIDEFRDYCKDNGVSTKQMVNMVQMASNYRTMQANENGIKNITEKSTPSIKPYEIDTAEEAVYAVKGDSKYDPVMDINGDDKVTFEEYAEYCQQHAKEDKGFSDTKVETSEDGSFKTSSASKAVKAYAKSESAPAEGKYEYYA